MFLQPYLSEVATRLSLTVREVVCSRMEENTADHFILLWLSSYENVTFPAETMWRVTLHVTTYLTWCDTWRVVL